MRKSMGRTGKQGLPAGQLVPGAFGENLTTAGLPEPHVRIGDCFQGGAAVREAGQPTGAAQREFEKVQRTGIEALVKSLV